MQKPATKSIFVSMLWIFALFINLQLPALRTLYKIFPSENNKLPAFNFIYDLIPLQFKQLIPLFIFVMFLLYAVVIYSELVNNYITRYLQSPWYTVVILILLYVVTYFLYPIADGLKTYNLGSDQDDGIINCATNLLQGVNPYEAKTYLNTYMSPGPGWIILWTPLVAMKSYWLLTPLCMTCASLALKYKTNQWITPNIFLLFVSSSAIFWELMIDGSDLIALGCMFLLISILLDVCYEKWSGGASDWLKLLALALVTGFVVTGREVFVYVPILLMLIYWRKNRAFSFTFGICSSMAYIGLNLIFYLWSPVKFTPFHLLAKGARVLPGNFRYLMIGTCFLAGLYILKYIRRDTINLCARMTILWISIFLPMAFTSAGNLLFSVHGNYSLWDGASWLISPMILLVAAVSLYMTYDLHRDEEQKG